MRVRLLLGVAVSALALPAGAQAAVTIGSNLARVPDNMPCAFNGPCTLGLEALDSGNQAAGGAKASLDGVIVRWRVRTSGSDPRTFPLKLRVIRGDTGAGSGTDQVLPSAAAIYTFEERLRVRSGDEIGVDTHGVRGGGAIDFGPPITRTTGGTIDLWNPPLLEGENRAPTLVAPGNELLINADVEPDADGDGFGDETQDGCPSDASTQASGQGACADTSGPNPDLTKTPKKKTESRTAVFRFISDDPNATFQCRLDKKPFVDCTSPKKYRKLRVRKHKFQVQGTDSKGNLGPLDSFRWRVVD